MGLYYLGIENVRISRSAEVVVVWVDAATLKKSTSIKGLILFDEHWFRLNAKTFLVR